jgi:uncharacterized membrane protein YecN with MAPEG domain
MNIDEWKKVVDTALRAQGKGFGTAQVDPVQIQEAFESGQSPVVFAKSLQGPTRVQQPPPGAVPMVEYFPHPHLGMLRFLHTMFTLAAWFIWIGGAILTLLAVLASIGLMKAGVPGAGAGAMGVVMALVFGLSYVFMGALSMLLAQWTALFVAVHRRVAP